MRNILLISILLLYFVSVNAQYGGVIRGLSAPRFQLNENTVSALKEDGWIEVKSHRKNKVGYPPKTIGTITERTWIKAVRQGGIDMIIAIIPELETERNGHMITKNPNYTDTIYEKKLEGEYSHRFVVRSDTLYIDLDFGDLIISTTPTNFNKETGNIYDNMHILVLVPLLLGVIFLIYSKK